MSEVIEIGHDELFKRVGDYLCDGYRLALVAAHDDIESRNCLRVVYVLLAGSPDRRVELCLRVDEKRPTVPSLASLSFPANRFEREMHDLFGIEPVGHHRPARLVMHQHWPEGWYPMRSSSGPPPAFGDESQPYPFLSDEGRGVYEVPVGPVHAGVIEPGHFRFSVVGETILNLKARLWFTHKGVEKLFEGRSIEDGVELAGRISGDTAVGHTLAYCKAVEAALAWNVPFEARILRAILLELERLYNHVADVGALCNDVGFGIIHSHSLRLRESLLRINRDVTGHRLLRGAIAPGVVTLRSLPEIEALEVIRADFAEIVDLALGNSTVVDRFSGTAKLTYEQAKEIGALGYVARASGLSLDARVDHDDAGLYRALELPMLVSGDVLGRFSVRVKEVDASVLLLRDLLSRVGVPVAAAQRPETSGPGHGLGLVEGWRGTIAHRVEVDDKGVLTRLKVVDPSFFNWPALPVTLADTILPDFPLTNKSFNLSYAGNDL